MFEYENEKSKTTFYPWTQKVFSIKVVLFFGLVNFFMLKYTIWKVPTLALMCASGIKVKTHAQWILICWVRYFGHEMDLTYFLLGSLGITRKSDIAIHGPVRALYIADIWVETTDENEIFTLFCNFTTEKMGIISIKSSVTSLNAECEKIA